MLAEEPDREIVVGAYTQPWHEQARFHPLPPEEFAGFDRPGYVKIAWTLQAEPLGPNDSLLITRTRAVATDPQSRKRFRRYWGPMSAGIILIRYAGLPLMRKEAERRAAAVGEGQLGLGNGRGGVLIEQAVDIRRSLEEVFDYCTESGREPEWNPRTRWIEQLTGGPVGRVFACTACGHQALADRNAARSIERIAAGQAVNSTRSHPRVARPVRSRMREPHGDRVV